MFHLKWKLYKEKKFFCFFLVLNFTNFFILSLLFFYLHCKWNRDSPLALSGILGQDVSHDVYIYTFDFNRGEKSYIYVYINKRKVMREQEKISHVVSGESDAIICIYSSAYLYITCKDSL